MGEDGFDLHLDLNEEPFGFAQNETNWESGSVQYTEPETSHEGIIERMRQLEAVMIRSRERQRWRETAACSSGKNKGVSTSVRESMSGMKRTCKNDSSDLVAKALGIDPVLRNRGNGGYYSCYICFNSAREPVLTCCGHLFCWPCFYKLPHIEMGAKECPKCRGEVKDSSIIPIYGSGSSDDSHKKLSHENEVPPRPHAQRVQSLRQQIYSGEEIPFESVQQHFTNIIGIMEVRSQGLAAVRIPDNRVYSSELIPSHRVSRVLGQGVEPHSSISFALNDSMDYMGRSIEGTQVNLNGHQYLRSSEEILRINDRDSFLQVAASVQPENRTWSPSAGHHFRVPSLPSSRINAVISSMNETTDAPINYNPTVPSSSSSRRIRSATTSHNASNGDRNSSSS